VLDEATAYIDPENEALVQRAVGKLVAGRTVLVIAHRLSTITGADQIVVLKDGAVAEQGSPAELLQSGGIFARMVKCQTESQNWTLEKA
jgi:ATP-binding cassette subfamily B protein